MANELVPKIANLQAAVQAESSGLPAASTFTTVQIPNPFGAGTITMIQLPADGTCIAYGVEGEAGPRVVMAAAPDTNGIYITQDPASLYDGLSIDSTGIHGLGGLTLGSVSAINMGIDAEWTSTIGGVIQGPIIHAPDGTKHRIKVSNLGVLSTEVVV